ncbi:hypothetical protein SEUCBS139899_006214 [Sporothrix eucalyptigena]|uniref:WD repeat protein n=1 Tax=Sporothrix eucalyptigena TaxID=1812306 RepID=A0ABP0ASC7_9PEZI
MPQNTENHFRFKKMKVKPVPYLPHFQLRHLLAAPSKSRVLYADVRGVVRQHNSATGKTDIALQFPSELRRVHISTIAAGEGLLVAGGLDGDYGITRIEPIHGGGVVYDRHHSQAFKKVHVGISNHIQVYRNRNGGGPVASLASNDSHVRVMDLTTQKIISDVEFSYPVNCTAVSPDGRLRVVVGDNKEAVVMAAEPERGLWNWQSPSHLKSACTPDILHTLGWHRDYGFACAWADDGYTLATGNQDRALNIWDIRKTSDISGARTPIATLRTIMAGVRSLHFSPAGSGKRVLVAAEEADVINIIDAQMYRKRQAFDVFGELGGVSFTDDGQDLFALCADPTRGGILHLERAGLISNAVDFDETADKNRPGYSNYDWPVPQSKPNFKQRNRDMQRLLRKAAMSDMELF